MDTYDRSDKEEVNVTHDDHTRYHVTNNEYTDSTQHMVRNTHPQVTMITDRQHTQDTEQTNTSFSLKKSP